MAPNTYVTEDNVLAVLAGVPLDQVAAQVPTTPADLDDAIEVYRAAGRAALEAQAQERGWFQVRVQFTDWHTAERSAAAHLSPRLREAQEAGTLTDWWFLRKHPCWRLRCRPGPKSTRADMTTAITALLDGLADDGTIERWWKPSLYEPETLAFGGPEGISLAHDLFHADSLGTLTYLRHNATSAQFEEPVGRKELSILLCTTLFRSARQDAHEQGDIWHRVVRERPLSAEPPLGRLRRMFPGLRRLMNLDTSPTSTLFAADGPLPFAVSWFNAFTTVGRGLADAAHDGTLEHGLRGVLANHVIFHWNRLGLPAGTQGILARAAREALMNPALDPAGD
ncbi:thiopeptide-type bacteriocin biosynthesis protein [Streptomyces sp. NPDC059455]|uniref:thiopeptide-type bacteriocin biosynthesis protein n=1 Tax=Streptomyces sp. NPDC059455 TaxID=3346837 RepID=UPI0036BE34C0